MPREYTHRPLNVRVWERIEQRGPDECWPTNGTHNPEGYALFFLAKSDRPQGVSKYTLVHRAVFFVVHGYWPTVCRHTCDRRWCANPRHLLDGTIGDNNRDTAARSANPARGEQHWHAALTEADVRAIRASTETQEIVAQRYGVSRTLIHKVRARKLWQHI